ncbi:MAG: hypothetical protein JO352_31725 [Chloroflexi bacterium]|nr:hypothetical protein [Chloroflexota bacterium]MBV9595697.1 hypothetical protein [Chloroflexota bacterium]
MFFDSFRPRLGRRGGAALIGLALSATAILPASSVVADHEEAQFPLVVANSNLLPCLAKDPSDPKRLPTAEVSVERGELNDTLKLRVHDLKPDLAFDLFTVQNSNKLADGSPDPNFKNFGLAWYQTDVQADHDGNADVTIKTILLDQIFGFDPAANLAPTNTFNVGFWFNNPNDAAACGFDVTHPTPFNGEHKAGPLAMISTPDAQTGLGPLCRNPETSGSTIVCNP